MSSNKGVFAQLSQSWTSLGKSRSYIYIAIIIITVSATWVYATPTQRFSDPEASANKKTLKSDQGKGNKVTAKKEKTAPKNAVEPKASAAKTPATKTTAAKATAAKTPAAKADPASPVASAPNTPSNTQGLLGLALFMLSIALCISIAVSFYLYRWRKILLANQNLAIPEEFVGSISHLNKHIAQLSQALVMHLQKLVDKNSVMDSSISDMTETFMTLQDSLDHKDTEIRRLKQGYDNTIFRKYLLRFVRVDQVIEDYKLDKPEFKDELNQIQSILVDALEECDVERFTPELGSDYRKSYGVADSPRVIEPKTTEDIAYNIAEVMEDGYRLILQDGYDVILPAKVKIYGKQ